MKSLRSALSGRSRTRSVPDVTDVTAGEPGAVPHPTPADAPTQAVTMPSVPSDAAGQAVAGPPSTPADAPTQAIAAQPGPALATQPGPAPTAPPGPALATPPGAALTGRVTRPRVLRVRRLLGPLAVVVTVAGLSSAAIGLGFDLLGVGLVACVLTAAAVAVRRRGRSTPRRAAATVALGVLGLGLAVAVAGVNSDSGRQPLMTVLQSVPRLAQHLVGRSGGTGPSPLAGPTTAAPRLRTTRLVTRVITVPVTTRITVTTGPTAKPTGKPAPSGKPTPSGKPGTGAGGKPRTRVVVVTRKVRMVTRVRETVFVDALPAVKVPPAGPPAVPARQEVLSFVSPDEDNTSTALERDAGMSTDLAITGATMGPGGVLQGVPGADDLVRAHAHQARGLLVVSNYDAAIDDMNGPMATAVLRSPAAVAALRAAIAQAVLTGGWDGVVVDLESLHADAAAGLVNLVAGLKADLGGREVVVSTPASDSPADLTGYDLPRLAAAADRIDWMAYDQNTAAGDAGPVAGLGWVRSGLATALRAVPAGKLLLGVAGYGYVWPAHGKPHELDYPGLLALEHTRGATVTRDPRQSELTVRLPGGGVAWFSDAAAVAARGNLAVQDRLAGVALWRVGPEDPATLGSLPLPPVKPVGLSTDGRPVVQVAATGLVALTFDDGPDPTWTPRILDVLRREHVPGTFFVVGRQALANPDLLTAEVAGGDVVGNHTYSHPDMNAVPAWRARLEVLGNEAVIQSIIGRRPLLYRSPYGDGDRVVGGRTRDELAGSLGLQTVSWTDDSMDWSRPGTDRIVTTVLGGAAPLTVVLMHDGGGDRSQTVAALPLIIERLKAEGYRFVTVPALDGAAAAAYAAPGSGWDQARWTAAVVGVRVAHGGMLALEWIALVVAGLSILRLLVGGPLALVHARRRRTGRPSRRRRPGSRSTGTDAPDPHPAQAGPDRTTRPGTDRTDADTDAEEVLPTVTVLIPAHNEAKVIASSLAGLTGPGGVGSPTGPVEVIVVDDGSTDDTAEVVTRFVRESGQPLIRLIRQEQSGKAAALNTGIRAARGEVVVVIDADTIVTPQLCPALARHFLDPAVGAVAGNVKVGNRHRLLSLLQAAEYVTSLNLDRRAQAVLNTMAVVPGAAGAFRRSALLALGGYPTQTLVEDADLTAMLLRAGWRIPYEPDAVAWTEAPERFRDALKQRRRWSYGTLQVLARHADVIGRRRYGALGVVGLPWNLVSQILLPALAPLVDLFLLIRVLQGNGGPVLVVLALAALLDAAMVAVVVVAERESWRLVACAPLLRWTWHPIQLVAVLLSFHRWLRDEEHRWTPSRRYATVDAVTTPDPRTPPPASGVAPVPAPVPVPVPAPAGVPLAPAVRERVPADARSADRTDAAVP